MVKSHPSDSKVQREIEKKIVQLISKELNIVFNENERVTTIEGVKFEFDFYHQEKKIIGEIYLGIDKKITAGPRKKVIADCFKLVYADKLLGNQCTKMLVFVDENTKENFERNSWIAKAIKEYEIKIRVEKIEPSDMDELRDAKRQQQIGNKKANT